MATRTARGPQSGAPAKLDPRGKGSAPAAKPDEKKQRVSPLKFFQQVRSEVAKVTWPSRNETVVSTIMVIVMVTLAILFFLVVDSILRFLAQLILG